MLVLLDSDARTRPRSQPTLYRYFGAVRPFIERWSAEHDHIREITTADVTAALGPLRGWPRRTAIAALRSLFRFAKRRGLVFTNPTTRLKAEDIERGRVPRIVQLTGRGRRVNPNQ